MENCHSASEYPTNAVVPANRSTERNGAPAGSARPAMYAAKIPTTTAYTNHIARGFAGDREPPGITVNTMTGPRLNVSINAGGSMATWVPGPSIISPTGGLHTSSMASLVASSLG